MTNTLPAPVGGAVPSTITDELTSAADYARSSSSPATLRAYASDWRDFSTWCAARGLDPLPASLETAAAYLAHQADSGLKVSTITRRAAAIAFAHRVRGLPPPTAAGPIKAVLKGIRRRIGVAVEQKAPATAHALRKMLKRVPIDTQIGIRDRAILLLGFGAALRRSELAALNVEDLEFTPKGLLVRIRSSKTDQEGEGAIVAVPRGNKLGVVAAVEAWLEHSQRATGPLFGICDRTVARVVKRWARAARLDPSQFSGHSLRAGFVTEALEHGADLFKVMDVTRHVEVRTLREYDRRAKAFDDHAGRKFL